jgi:iron complex outermembrane receptor protein
MTGNYLRPVLAAALAAALIFGLCPPAPAAVTLPDTAVTATRSEQSLDRLARNVTVITRQDIDESQARNLVDLLNGVPGLSVINYTGTAAAATVDLRGFGEGAATRVLIMVDGRRVNSIDLSGADLTVIPVDNIERIEVLHGPAGVLYGDNAVGGVINIITRKGAGKPAFKVGGYYGTYQSWGLNANAGGGVDKFSYFVSAGHDATDGYRDNSDSATSNFTFSTRYDASEKLGFLVDGGYTRADYGLPGSLTQAQVDDDRTQTTAPNDNADRTDWFVRGRVNARFPVGGDFTCDLSYRSRQDNSEWASFTSRRETDIQTLGVTPRYVLDSAINGLNNRFTVGLDYYLSTSTLDELTVGGPKYNTTDFDWQTLGLYLLEELTFARDFTFSLGGRWQRGDFDIDNQPVGGLENQDSFKEDQYAWSAGLAWAFTPGAKVYGRVSRTFRFPVADEYFTFGGFMALEPETAMAYEIGASYTFMQNGRVSLTGYWMDMSDEIAYNNLTMMNENLDDTRHRGVEMTLQVPFGPGNPSHAFGSFSYENPEFSSGTNDGNTIPLVPEVQASVGVRVQIMEGLSAMGRVRYVGERYMGQDFANEAEKMDAYATLDLGANYTYKGITVFLRADNVLGAEYDYASFYSTFGSGFYPATTQQVWGGVRYEF